MDDDVLFFEIQRFNQWWVWLILVGSSVLALFPILTHDHQGHTAFGVITIAVLVAILLMTLRLETKIKRDGIYVRFFPIHLKFKHYAWEKLKKSYVRRYSAILEYGGWGLRYGLFGRGKAYSVSGNQGLQLELLDGGRLLVGTKKPNELTETLKKMGQLKQ